MKGATVMDRPSIVEVATEETEAKLKTQFRQRFLTLPGSTEAEFDRAWPLLLDEYRKQQVRGGQSPREQLLDEMRELNRNAGRPD